ncbi:MAG: tetratricopeptide repeat protein [Pseudomonadota bacterium]
MKQLAVFFAACLCHATAAAFSGSDTCRDCHAAEYEHWRGSHHDLAMQLPTESSVLGDFDNATFDYNGVTSKFYRKGDKFMVSTDGEDGKQTEFEVAYVFGVEPLQQYLLPLSRGRLQALSIAWDARPESAGGQRWYHLYPDETINHEDPLHWTGPYQNWNTRCAECHSTDLQKNYDAATRSFATEFFEVNVACEACHGPGGTHVQLAKAGQLSQASHGGFPTQLKQRGAWKLAEGESIARRSEPLSSKSQIDNCGRCHSRRGTLGDYHYGADLLDTHRLSLPQWPLYHPDGQILDEVYVYGSFVQSKMHMEGVVCTNCHEPHSLQLRAPGNGVCAQCHVPSSYDTPEHHHHPVASTGAQCVNCHMPETTYMGVDPRRDHSMRVPRPDLSVVIGTPNACNQCHTEQTAEWSLQALRKWGISFRDTASHPARAFHSIAAGDTRAVPTLTAIAADSGTPPIWRATAMEALGQVGGRPALQAATTILYDDEPLLRASTIRALEFLPVQQRQQLLMPLVDDEVASVRMEVASSLAALPLQQLPEQQRKQLEPLFAEYQAMMEEHADMPGMQIQQGIFHSEQGNYKAAEAAYLEALHLNPQLVPAYLNLAELLRSQGKEPQARDQLKQALAVAPNHGPTLHALGLSEIRSGNRVAALDYLKRAADVEELGTRHRFVYAIALHDTGQPQMAIQQLMDVLREAHANPDVLLALTNYHAELDQIPAARAYAEQLVHLAPNNASYQRLLQQLSR